MWGKIRDYCLDISKYFMTAVLISSFMDDFSAAMHWLVYVLSLVLGAGLFALALFFDKREKKEKEEKNTKELITNEEKE